MIDDAIGAGRQVETGRPMQLTFFEHPILNSPYAYPGNRLGDEVMKGFGVA